MMVFFLILILELAINAHFQQKLAILAAILEFYDVT